VTDDPSGYLAFLLRLWQPVQAGRPIWRASVDNPHTAERHYFADLDALFAFLEEQTTHLKHSRQDEGPPHLLAGAGQGETP
jgi:hypothetical protein